jgi:hypothetical protein
MPKKFTSGRILEISVRMTHAYTGASVDEAHNLVVHILKTNVLTSPQYGTQNKPSGHAGQSFPLPSGAFILFSFYGVIAAGNVPRGNVPSHVQPGSAFALRSNT